MRDVAIGYCFIMLAMLVFIVSMFMRRSKLLRRMATLKEELRDSTRR